MTIAVDLGRKATIPTNQPTKSVNQTGISGGFRGNPPLRLKYLIFLWNFQKNQATLINDLIKLTNRAPLCKFEPPIKTSWICRLFEQILKDVLPKAE